MRMVRLPYKGDSVYYNPSNIICIYGLAGSTMIQTNTETNSTDLTMEEAVSEIDKALRDEH